MARSCSEVEDRALAHIATDITRVHQLFLNLGISPGFHHLLWCDNQCAIALASNLIPKQTIYNLWWTVYRSLWPPAQSEPVNAVWAKGSGTKLKSWWTLPLIDLRILLTGIKWLFLGSFICWHAKFTAKDTSGLVKVRYCLDPPTVLHCLV